MMTLLKRSGKMEEAAAYGRALRVHMIIGRESHVRPALVSRHRTLCTCARVQQGTRPQDRIRCNAP